MLSYRMPPGRPRVGPLPASSAICLHRLLVHKSSLRPADRRMAPETDKDKTKERGAEPKNAQTSDALAHGNTCMSQAKPKSPSEVRGPARQSFLKELRG